MSLTELMEHAIAFLEVGLLSMSVYLTVVTGYLFVAFKVGRSLSRFQLITITFLFLSFATILTLSTFASLQSAINMFGSMQRSGTEGWLYVSLHYGAYIAPLIQFMGIVMSVVFMHQTRK